ncbi:hypothetical protein V1508DRAFT_425066, partial [Lipomyces doorenjongii]|uniref:uncharacterized protein n=1 Tax=Lipomyces doorenjongii TaxID=383834 RepID=UPI0034CD78FA
MHTLSESMDSSDSILTKRRLDGSGLSIRSHRSPSQRHSRQIGSQSDRLGRRQHHTANPCTQRLGRCPNVELHRQGRDMDRHLVSSEHLVQLLKQQLDEDPDS